MLINYGKINPNQATEHLIKMNYFFSIKLHTCRLNLTLKGKRPGRALKHPRVREYDK